MADNTNQKTKSSQPDESSSQGQGVEVEVENSAVEGDSGISMETPNGALSYEDLEAALQRAEQQLGEYADQLMRVQADTENARRRNEREMDNARKFALERFANELLPVMDSLELGLAAAKVEGAATDKLREGVELTLRMLGAVFQKFGIVEVNPLNMRFNPDQHQAMQLQTNNEVEPNTVTAVYQKGYLLNDRLLRPALVVVSQGGAKGSGAANDG